MPRKTQVGEQDARLAGAASMRPRPDAAENNLDSIGLTYLGVASMRPRPDAAENVGRAPDGISARIRFNEAAARCRGKRRGRCACWSRWHRFNEAAARCRGKRALAGNTEANALVASMRPRPDAAENLGQGAAETPESPASMRPRPDAAENGAVNLALGVVLSALQ